MAVLNQRSSQSEPALEISQPEVALTLRAGETYTSRIEVKRKEKGRLQGVVTSDNRRILLAENSFRGESCAITYGVDTKGLPAGEQIRGNLILISNAGELSIPVRVRVISAVDEKAPEVESLSDFTALCQKSLRDGFSLFTEPEFTQLLTGEDAAYRALYRGLSKGPVNYQRMEEFLVAAGQKEALTFSVDHEEKSFFGVKEREQDTIYLYKNTWGYEQLEITAEGKFLELSRKRVLTDDFVGRVCSFDFVVNPEYLGEGVRRGRIRISGAHTNLVVEVVASKKSEANLVPDLFEEQQRVKLYRCALDFREGRIDEKQWQTLSATFLRELRLANPSSAEYLLFEAYLAWKRGDIAHAMEFLWPLKDGTVAMKSDEERCAYLTLAKATTLLPDEQRDIFPELERAASENPASYLLYRLRRAELTSEPSDEQRFARLERCALAGSMSPFLYDEALRILSENSAIFRKLSAFELRVLLYAEKRDRVTEALARRMAFLSHNLKQFSGSAYRLLVRWYERFETEDFLEAICRLIVRAQPIRRNYNRWYRLAIEHNLRITQVYEYYMETVPEDATQDFPLPVLMYFSSNDTLGARRKALLYAGIVLHKEEMPDIYRMYRTRLRNFAVRLLEEGRISENCAILYRNFFLHPHDGRTATLLSRVLFTHTIAVDDPGYRKVIVCSEAMKEEISAPVENGRAYLPVYTKDCRILFEDQKRRRVATGVSYEMEPLFDVRESIADCNAQNVRHTGLLLATCRERSYQMQVTEQNVSTYRLAERDESFTDAYRRTIRRMLLDYYLARPDDFSRVDFVSSMDPDLFAEADKPATVSLLMEEGRYEDTFRLLYEYGYENIATGLLLQLASRMITRREGEYDEELLYMAVYVCREGKYNDDILCYLRNYYDGPVEKLCVLWHKLTGFQLDTFRLEEKILKQCVFANAFPEEADQILRHYLKEQGNRSVVVAFLAHLCRAKMTGEHPVSEAVLTILDHLANKEVPFSTGMKLCLLAYYAEQRSLTKEQMSKAAGFLKELNDAGIRLSFFKQLPHELIEQYQLEDKVFIEKRMESGQHVYIHYRVDSGAEESDDSSRRMEVMKEVYHGLYVKELLLFYGETVSWYLTCGEGKEEIKLEENTTRITKVDTRGTSRFNLLNRILRDLNEGRKLEANAALSRYLRQDAYVREYFRLM